jgi:Leucine-rich repeat (LRR) protein
LKRVYLSNNFITDISPLFELDGLDYVDLTGNKIKAGQVEKLTKTGITVET